MPLKMHRSLHAPVGEWLNQEIVQPYGFSPTTLSRKFGVTRQAMSTLLNGRAGLSADMAIRFEKGFGISADTLMRMQAAYDLAQARAHEDQLEVDRVPTLAAEQ